MRDTGETFKDAAAFSRALGKCMATGVKTGGNPAAAKQAENDVRAFVTRVLHP